MQLFARSLLGAVQRYLAEARADMSLGALTLTKYDRLSDPWLAETLARCHPL